MYEAEVVPGVGSGEVWLDGEAAQRLQEALWAQTESVDAMRAKARAMARRAPLGSYVVAQAMADKFQRRADGDARSLLAVLDKYYQTLLDAHRQVGAAIRNHRETDESSAAAMIRIRPW
nr:hypothetical protein [Kibdelosporangium sp. MJ126-NF4]